MKFCCENNYSGKCQTPGQLICDCCEGECGRLGICRYEKAQLDLEEQRARIAALKAIAGDKNND